MGSPFSLPPNCTSRVTRLYLNFGYLSPSQFRTIVLQCPSLQTIVAYNEFQSKPPHKFDDLSPLRLPSLSFLQIYGVGTLVSFNLLRLFSSSLNAPAMCHRLLVAEPADGRVSWTTIPSFSEERCAEGRCSTRSWSPTT